MLAIALAVGAALAIAPAAQATGSYVFGPTQDFYSADCSTYVASQDQDLNLALVGAAYLGYEGSPAPHANDVYYIGIFYDSGDDTFLAGAPTGAAAPTRTPAFSSRCRPEPRSRSPRRRRSCARKSSGRPHRPRSPPDARPRRRRARRAATTSSIRRGARTRVKGSRGGHDRGRRPGQELERDDERNRFGRIRHRLDGGIPAPQVRR